jgi:hypothetical protein
MKVGLRGSGPTAGAGDPVDSTSLGECILVTIVLRVSAAGTAVLACCVAVEDGRNALLRAARSCMGSATSELHGHIQTCT